MYPVKNPTKYALENFEHQMAAAIDEVMLEILDNGDRPDKRIQAIIGLTRAKANIINAVHRIAYPIHEE